MTMDFVNVFGKYINMLIEGNFHDYRRMIAGRILEIKNNQSININEGVLNAFTPRSYKNIKVTAFIEELSDLTPILAEAAKNYKDLLIKEKITEFTDLKQYLRRFFSKTTVKDFCNLDRDTNGALLKEFYCFGLLFDKFNCKGMDKLLERKIRENRYKVMECPEVFLSDDYNDGYHSFCTCINFYENYILGIGHNLNVPRDSFVNMLWLMIYNQVVGNLRFDTDVIFANDKKRLERIHEYIDNEDWESEFPFPFCGYCFKTTCPICHENVEVCRDNHDNKHEHYLGYDTYVIDRVSRYGRNSFIRNMIYMNQSDTENFAYSIMININSHWFSDKDVLSEFKRHWEQLYGVINEKEVNAAFLIRDIFNGDAHEYYLSIKQRKFTDKQLDGIRGLLINLEIVNSDFPFDIQRFLTEVVNHV